MKRAYSPRRSTVDLIAEILAVPGIRSCRTIAPIRSAWTTRPTMLRITTDGYDGNGQAIYSDFTLADARAWLASEKAAAR